MTTHDQHEREQRCGLTLEQWFALALELRKAWWSETDYGAKVASDELVAKIKAAAEGNVTASRPLHCRRLMRPFQTQLCDLARGGGRASINGWLQPARFIRKRTPGRGEFEKFWLLWLANSLSQLNAFLRMLPTVLGAQHGNSSHQRLEACGAGCSVAGHYAELALRQIDTWRVGNFETWRERRAGSLVDETSTLLHHNAGEAPAPQPSGASL